MSVPRDWFWQLGDKGPDWVFIATFKPSDAVALVDLVSRHPLPGLVRNIEFINPNRSAGCTTYALWEDEFAYEKLKEGGFTGFGVSIEICDHKFSIERTLQGGSFETANNETALIIALAQSPNLTLVEWKVAYNGYSWGQVAGGASADELLEYLEDTNSRA